VKSRDKKYFQYTHLIHNVIFFKILYKTCKYVTLDFSMIDSYSALAEIKPIILIFCLKNFRNRELSECNVRVLYLNKLPIYWRSCLEIPVFNC